VENPLVGHGGAKCTEDVVDYEEVVQGSPPQGRGIEQLRHVGRNPPRLGSLAHTGRRDHQIN